MGWHLILTHKFKVLSGLVVLLLATGTIFYHSVEGFTLLDSFYFTAVTLTTVGYGDFAPGTSVGKAFTVAYLFLGIGIILAFLNLVATQRIKRRSYKTASLKKEAEDLKEKMNKMKKKK